MIQAKTRMYNHPLAKTMSRRLFDACEKGLTIQSKTLLRRKDFLMQKLSLVWCRPSEVSFLGGILVVLERQVNLRDLGLIRLTVLRSQSKSIGVCFISTQSCQSSQLSRLNPRIRKWRLDDRRNYSFCLSSSFFFYNLASLLNMWQNLLLKTCTLCGYPGLPAMQSTKSLALILSEGSLSSIFGIRLHNLWEQKDFSALSGLMITNSARFYKMACQKGWTRLVRLQKTHPRAHKSTGNEQGWCWIISGAKQIGVPTLLFYWGLLQWTSLDSPKSPSNSVPSSPIKMFWSLISLCIILSPCKYFIPKANCPNISHNQASLKFLS